MELWKAAIVGIIQGITEFLPISSSAHIVFAQDILDIREHEFLLTIIVHFGTLIAVFIALWNRLVPVTIGTLEGVAKLARGRSPWADERFRWGVYIIIASIPAAIIGLAFEKQIEAGYQSARAASIQLFISGFILFATGFVRGNNRNMNLAASVAVGIAQAISIIPGISRSGATIATALYCKVDRQKAAEFSFLLSIPVIVGGSLLAFEEIATNPALVPLIGPFFVGFAASTIAGYFSIKLLIHIVRRGQLTWFAYYCWIVGAIGVFYF